MRVRALAVAMCPSGQSPYNTSNPHFGYPAYVPSSSLDPSGTPRSRFPRRRKRDLVRTLTYLAALRFLALHRAIQYRLNVFVAVLLRMTGLGWWRRWRQRRSAGLTTGEHHRDAASDKKVHWTASATGSTSASPDESSPSPPPPFGPGSGPVPHAPHHRSHHLQHQHLSSALVTSSSTSPSPLIDIDPAVLYLALVFVIVRTPDRTDKAKRLGRFLLVGFPTWSVAQVRGLALRLLVGKERADALLFAEQRAS